MLDVEVLGYGYLYGLGAVPMVVPQTELETALANAYPQDLEKLAVDLLSERDFVVEPTGTSGPDGGLDALLHDGDRVGALHVSRTRSDRLREKVISDAEKLAEHDQSYDFFVFVTTADPSGSLRRRIESEIQEKYGWKTDIWAREQLRNVLMTEHQGLAREHLNVNPGGRPSDHRDEIKKLRNERLDRIEARADLPNALPDDPVLAIHLIPNNVFSTDDTHPADLPTPPFFAHSKRAIGGGKPVGDGVVAFNLRMRQEHPNYVYLNETGWVEAVSTEYFRPNPAGTGGFIDPDIDRAIGATVKGVLYCFEELTVKPPLFVSVALLGVDQYVIDTGEFLHFESGSFSDRFTTPLAELQQLDPDEFELEHLRPILDRIWYQAGRSNGSPNIPNPEDSTPPE